MITFFVPDRFQGDPMIGPKISESHRLVGRITGVSHLLTRAITAAASAIIIVGIFLHSLARKKAF